MTARGYPISGSDLMRRAADNGNARANYALGEKLMTRGKNKNAVDRYRKAAEAGHLDSQVRMIQLSAFLEVGERRKWVDEAASRGHPKALRAQGLDHFWGEGTPRIRRKV